MWKGTCMSVEVSHALLALSYILDARSGLYQVLLDSQLPGLWEQAQPGLASLLAEVEEEVPELQGVLGAALMDLPTCGAALLLNTLFLRLGGLT
ncbi:hypothetical protein HaLaN_08109, partial [Haematococcus lacustris]